MQLDLDRLGVGKSYRLLNQRQLDVDPLSQIFYSLETPVSQQACWGLNVKSDITINKYRHFLLVQLNGANFTHHKRVRTTCGTHNCCNPWHAKRVGKAYQRNHKLQPVQYPDITDRTALLLWYAAGNSPVRALDVEDVNTILQAAGDDVRPDAFR